VIEPHFALSALMLAGLVADEIGRRTKLSRVALLAVIGVIVGPFGIDLVPALLRR